MCTGTMLPTVPHLRSESAGIEKLEELEDGAFVGRPAIGATGKLHDLDMPEVGKLRTLEGLDIVPEGRVTIGEMAFLDIGSA